MLTSNDRTILAKTRAEEHDADVWGKFFIPPYFDALALKTATKSTYIAGKRGCGKTMLLKYLDYHTAFSPRRDAIPDDEIGHIAIYWRVDTQFCNSMQHRGIAEEEWIVAFESYFAVVIALEIVRALRTIATSSYRNFSLDDLAELRLDSLPDFHQNFPSDPIELQSALERMRRQFGMWVSNVSSTEKPILPPGKMFIDTLISDIRRSPNLSDACFFVYVDEVENLTPYQRRVLNSFLKHSQRPFIVNFTSKVQSNENMTTGSEWVNATHDFRLIELESLLPERDRTVFFAEVLLGNLDIAESRTSSALFTRMLSPEGLPARRAQQAQEEILGEIRRRFPSREVKQIAREAVGNPKLLSKLVERINQALRRRGAKFDAAPYVRFLDSVPEAIVILPALLNRETQNPATVLGELERYASEQEGSFASTWIHNNLVGSLLELYRPYGRICPIYSGFDTFVTMANGNLRHFLILCYKAVEVAELNGEDEEIFSIDTQARAAYDSADQLLQEINTFGSLGPRLRMFVLRLGSIFRALQASPAMSEPEQNQITINSGGRVIGSQEIEFISEANKYGILVEQLETKSKNSVGRDGVDYQLNPIYAPYFQISYRRKRKIPLSVEQFAVLIAGTEDEYSELTRTITRQSDGRETPQMDLLQ
ncbi:hypothetical protein [Cupriavidus malaysiensis]|uniref:ORC-CDC6 family AAA ATPase n=1 Tax=Cupriavidus malaysiensis TaxID=367825 RepID=UPI000AABC71F|nr:hypothetical protein [Cupriavidus malaysiensis]